MAPGRAIGYGVPSVRFLEWIVGLIRDPGALIVWGGYPGLAAIVFLETGAMIFFLPGDSLLVMAGLYAAKGDLDIWFLNFLLIPMAVAGDATSYWIGRRTGPRLFNRPRSRLFRPEHVRAAHDFYERHGGKAIILARFMPLVRTFVPVVAGVAGMTYRHFAAFNVIGGAAWVASMTLVGYLLGTRFPLLVEHIEKVIVVVVFLSILPGIVEVLRARRRARLARASEPQPPG
ncbi:MAG: VTT domain-containing protein [Deltaproteobacteria bacterium]|nr:VTT domain-containing protein [Deltaproteobacteria bacterium]